MEDQTPSRRFAPARALLIQSVGRLAVASEVRKAKGCVVGRNVANAACLRERTKLYASQKDRHGARQEDRPCRA